MSYPNFKAELKRLGITYKDAAALLGMSLNNFSMKMNGKVSFTVNEVKKVRDEFCHDASLDYLLEESKQVRPGSTKRQ